MSKAMRKFYQKHRDWPRDKLGAYLLSIHMREMPGSCGAPSGASYLRAMHRDPDAWMWTSIDDCIREAQRVPCPHCGQLCDPEGRGDD